MFFINPVLWPILLVYYLKSAAKWHWVDFPSPTAWDTYFSAVKNGCWIVIKLKGGEWVGGRFGKNSAASSYPEPGHIYIEELWDLDNNQKFVTKRPGPEGIILRPSDYDFVRVLGEY